MSEFKSKVNPFTGQLQLIPTNIVLAFKAGVAKQTDLPLSGNAKGDARIVNDTGHLYVWSINDSSGLLTDWVDVGDIIDLNWSAISGKPSSAVADIDDAVSKRHNSGSDDQIASTVPTDESGKSVQDVLDEKTTLTDVKADSDISDAIDKKHTQNTDEYLTTMTTNVLYVDNKRTDTYTENGSITKPFKTIQSAIDAITGNSSSNRFQIHIAQGTYADNLTINKDYVHFVGEAVYTRITGNITIAGNAGAGVHVRFNRLSFRTGSISAIMNNHFSVMFSNCDCGSGTIWTITALTPSGDEWLQIFGGLINVTLTTTNANIGLYESVEIVNRIWNINGGYFHAYSAVICFQTVNLNSACAGEVLCASSEDGKASAIIDLNTASTLITDAVTLGNITVTNDGTGIVTNNTKASNINNDSTVSGTTVKDALDTLANDKYTQGTEITLKIYSQDTEPILNDISKMAIWINTSDSNKVYLVFNRSSGGDQVKVELS